MSELDLTAAIEAGRVAARQRYIERNGFGDVADEIEVAPDHYAAVYAEAAVRAAAPIIERAVREAHGRHFSFGCVKCQVGARDAGWVDPETWEMRSPTRDAYDAARRALEKHHERADRAEAERDALLPVVEAARAWRKSEQTVGYENSHTLTGPEAAILATVDALDSGSEAEPA